MIELIQDQLRIGLALQVNDQAHWFAAAGAAFIADRANSLNSLFFDERADGLMQAVPSLLEGHLGDDDLGPAAFLSNVGSRSQDHLASPGPIAFKNSLSAADDASGREIRTGDDFHQLIDRDLRLVDQLDRRVTDLAQVVRRNLGRHADGDAVGAVDEEVRKLAGQNQRLTVFTVVVVDEINGIAFQVLEHRRRNGRQPRLGVAKGRWRQPGDRAEVALRMDQAVPHDPILSHPHQRRIYRLIAVRMIALHRLADDAGALAGGSGWPQPEIVHRQENPPLRWLETVAHVGQSPADDDAHGIGKVTVLELVLDIERLITVTVAIGGWTRSDRRIGGWQFVRQGRFLNSPLCRRRQADDPSYSILYTKIISKKPILLHPILEHFSPVFLKESSIIMHFSEAVLLLATGFFFLHRGSAGYAGVPASPSRLTKRLSTRRFPQAGRSTRGRWRFEWPIPDARSLPAAWAPGPRRSQCPLPGNRARPLRRLGVTCPKPGASTACASRRPECRCPDGT